MFPMDQNMDSKCLQKENTPITGGADRFKKQFNFQTKKDISGVPIKGRCQRRSCSV
jgi:hypothetical protein